jgi:hypothetical protein
MPKLWVKNELYDKLDSIAKTRGLSVDEFVTASFNTQKP